MATKNKSTKLPSAKQLKARAKFTRMVRARAKEAKRRTAEQSRAARARVGRPAAKRSRTTTNPNPLSPLSCVKNGKRLYGAAAAAVLRSRSKKSGNPIRLSEAQARHYSGKIKGFSFSGGGTPKRAKPAARRSGKRKKQKAFKKQGLFSGRGFLGLGRSKKRIKVRNKSTGPSCVKKNPKAKANKGFLRGHIKRAVSSRLHKSIRFGKRRRNQAPAGVAQMHETFLGTPVRSSRVIAAPDGTPRDVAVIGQIVQLKSETETFDFKPGEAPLGANPRGDLFVLGKTKVESNADFGKLMEISYVAKKDHLNKRLTEYFHKFGEEGGRAPKLKTDREGMFHIVGGSYSIESAGITD